ncbi:hypothetical protein CC79DRAFT_1336146 [Sarocladium strictum]
MTGASISVGHSTEGEAPIDRLSHAAIGCVARLRSTGKYSLKMILPWISPSGAISLYSIGCIATLTPVSKFSLGIPNATDQGP